MTKKTNESTQELTDEEFLAELKTEKQKKFEEIISEPNIIDKVDQHNSDEFDKYHDPDAEAPEAYDEDDLMPDIEEDFVAQPLCLTPLYKEVREYCKASFKNPWDMGCIWFIIRLKDLMLIKGFHEMLEEYLSDIDMAVGHVSRLIARRNSYDIKSFGSASDGFDDPEEILLIMKNIFELSDAIQILCEKVIDIECENPSNFEFSKFEKKMKKFIVRKNEILKG